MTSRNDLVYQVKFLRFMVSQDIKKSLQHSCSKKNMNLVHQVCLAGGACSLGILEDEPIDHGCGFRSCILDILLLNFCIFLHFSKSQPSIRILFPSSPPPSNVSISTHCKLSWPDPSPHKPILGMWSRARSRDQNSLSMYTRISCIVFRPIVYFECTIV